MKFILIAVYLAHGGDLPRVETRQFTDKAECHALAARYVKQTIRGPSRAFCLPLKETLHASR